MDKDFASKNKIVCVKKTCPPPIEMLNGCPLASKYITLGIQPLRVTMGDQVLNIIFNVIQSPTNSMVLCLPRFELHNLDIH